MLLGALMVLTPTGAGANGLPDGTVVIVGGGNVPICHATNSETNPYILNAPSYSSTGVITGVNHHGHDGPVFEPGMKAAKIKWGDIIPPISLDGATLHYEGKNWTDAARELYSVCIGEPEPQGAVLIVEKDVPGEDDDPTEFSFTVDQGESQLNADDIADGGFFETEVAAGSVSVTEADEDGYTLTDVSCVRDYVGADDELVEGETVQVSVEDGTASLPAADGDIITCVFTNTPSDGLTVVKSVTGGNAPTTWEFDFTTCDPEGGGDEVFTAAVQQPECENFTLTNGSVSKFLEGNYFEVTELDDANLTTIDCRDEQNEPVPFDRDGSTAAVEFSGRVTCTFTNDFPGGGGFTPTPTTVPEVEPTSLQVVKAVDGPGAPDTWAVDFEVIGASVDEAFGVDNVISSRSFSDIEPGVYDITESLPAGDAGVLTDVTCLDGATEVLSDVDGSTATVVLAEGDDVVCTFTNSYAAVLPDEVTTTTTTVAPATTAAPAPQVLGDVVTLPRTGNETRNLTGLGAVLLALGAALVVGSNRRLVKS